MKKVASVLLILACVAMLTEFYSCKKDKEEPACTTPATPTATSNSPVSAGNTVILNATAITGATYSWTGPNGFTSDHQAPEIGSATSAAAGTYSVTATVDGCTSAAGTTTVTITAAGTSGQFTDARDSKVYHWIKIGTQNWMLENLDYNAVSGSKVYGDSASYESTYGRLYTWAAMQTAAPAGYHVPTLAEWNTLISYLGGAAVAGGKMKETGLSHWLSPNTGADNSSGLTLKPGGKWRYNQSDYTDRRLYAYFWTNTEFNSFSGNIFILYYNDAAINSSNANKGDYLSIRCIKD
jgi:uncharacterized protein (TIGR02145 family)